jgi:RNA polymerase sigma factor (sigma-70 family)
MRRYDPGVPDDDPRHLVERSAAGDRDAMDALVLRYGPGVRAALHASLAPDVRARVDTDDLFQSTMTAALADLRSFRWEGEPAFRAWLLTVARNEARMAGRFQRRQSRAPKREEGAPDAAEGVAADRTTPSVAAVRGETSRRVEDAVASLPEDERRVVDLHSQKGLSFGETARILGLADEDAARYVFRRALKRLGEILDAGQRT